MNKVDIFTDSSQRAYAVHKEIPELWQATSKNVIRIATGDYAIADRMHKFKSREFLLCTGYALRSEFHEKFGFLHAFPGQELSDDDLEQLAPLKNGQLLPIEGSRSAPKTHLVNTLKDALGITLLHPISEDTGVTPFHVVFRPADNQIVMARIHYKDVRTFDAF